MTIETLVEKTFATAEAAERLAAADAQFAIAFVALSADAQARCWRGLDHGAKFRLVVRRIEAIGKDWTPSTVEAFIAKYDERFALGPVEQAIEGALERLAEESAGAMRLARADKDKAGATFWQRTATSYTNALIEYRKGVRPALLASGAWLLPSRRPGEAPHIVRMDGDWVCSCKAGASMHWSLALIIGIEVAHDDMQQFDDGDLEDADAALVALAAPIIDQLDRIHGDSDFEADADDPAPREWRIGAFMAAALELDPPGDCPLGDDEGDSIPDTRSLGQRIAESRRATYVYAA